MPPILANPRFSGPRAVRELEHGVPNVVANSTELEQNMTTKFGPKPIGTETHHVVPFSDRRAEPARKIMSKYGVSLEDADNGAWLSREYHDTLSRNSYFTWLNEKLSHARSESDVREALRSIVDDLKTGRTFPRAR